MKGLRNSGTQRLCEAENEASVVFVLQRLWRVRLRCTESVNGSQSTTDSTIQDRLEDVNGNEERKERALCWYGEEDQCGEKTKKQYIFEKEATKETHEGIEEEKTWDDKKEKGGSECKSILMINRIISVKIIIWYVIC